VARVGVVLIALHRVRSISPQNATLAAEYMVAKGLRIPDLLGLCCQLYDVPLIEVMYRMRIIHRVPQPTGQNYQTKRIGCDW
jgi:hypothetical protein